MRFVRIASPEYPAAWARRSTERRKPAGSEAEGCHVQPASRCVVHVGTSGSVVVMAALERVPRNEPDDTWLILPACEGAGAQVALALGETHDRPWELPS